MVRALTSGVIGPLIRMPQPLRDPEQPRQVAGDRLVLARRHVDLRQRPLRQDGKDQQRRVGLGDAPFEGDGERRRPAPGRR